MSTTLRLFAISLIYFFSIHPIPRHHHHHFHIVYCEQQQQQQQQTTIKSSNNNGTTNFTNAISVARFFVANLSSTQLDQQNRRQKSTNDSYNNRTSRKEMMMTTTTTTTTSQQRIKSSMLNLLNGSAATMAIAHVSLEEAFVELLLDQLKQGNFYFYYLDQLLLNVNDMKQQQQQQQQQPKLRFFCMEKECLLNQKLIQIPNDKYGVNGCGSYNINVDFKLFNMDGFNSCCNIHDVCYQECEKSKSLCDKLFENCLLGFCNRWTKEQNWNEVKSFS